MFSACAPICSLYFTPDAFRFRVHRPLARHHDSVPNLPNVAFQGALGAFSELAIQQYWPTGADVVPCRTFPETLATVVAKRTDFAVIPVHNAIAGPVHAALTALANVGDRIRQLDEFRVKINMCLMAPPSAMLAGIVAVHSHPVALAQCRIFFARHGWLVPTAHEDTAGAARDVAQLNNRTIGAIASIVAAKRYGLEVLAEHVEDVPANWTRFVVVTAS